MKFSSHEVRDLFFAWILLSIAFAILFVGERGLFTSQFPVFFGISFLTAGIGFVLHELAHKIVAQKYRLWAEFKASYGMLLIAIGLSFVGFIFAAPGAVYIHGMITKERNGKISVAGPIVNIVLAVLFLIPLLILGDMNEIIQLFFILGFRINALLAIFNMIPVMPFDGAKVIAWNKGVYWIVTIIALILFLGSWVI